MSAEIMKVEVLLHHGNKQVYNDMLNTLGE